ncbi:MAG: DUF4381 domain-containing protein [Parvibaculaceae bacterium]|nr:DUF4381 domain-containing protein [Parvibaculaceae bacterium]
MALEFPKVFGNYALKGLEEISSPDPISAMPQGPGWWFLAGTLLLVGGVLVYYVRKKWSRNAYRRHAVAALEALEITHEGPTQNWHAHRQSLPEILRATALHAFPRRNVVAVTGESWRVFLNAATQTPLWSEQTFQVLYALSYRPASAQEISEQEAQAVIQATKAWVLEHKPQLAQSSVDMSGGENV